MADIRIKDLTTTASSTASDDFIAVDGTTNGTRKLNAFSPTFGGNATVGGTLTVNGASIATAGQISSTATSALLAPQVYIYNGSSSGTNAALSGSQFLAQPGYSLFVGTTGNGTAASYQGGQLASVVQDQQNYVVGDAARGLLLHAVNGVLRFATGNTGVQRGYFDASGLKVETTTASTSTSSGALVVSGGVGVAGAVFSGGYVHPGGDSNFYIRGTNSGNGLIYGNIVSADVGSTFRVRNAAGSSTYLDVDSSNVTISSGVGLKLGNAYVAGAPTATGYIVIKDSTGTSYKIPAVAL
jgi:hypothetical protein